MQSFLTPRRFNILLIGLFFVTLLVAFSFQGTRGLYEPTEGRYAQCGLEMLESGNFFAPTLNHEPHLTKPPLTYWAIAAGIKLFGSNAWGVRFYNAILFSLIVLLITWLASVLWDKKAGLIAGFIYATAPFPAIGAFFVTTDNFLAFWNILTALCYIKSVKNPVPRQSYFWLLAMWTSLGFGYLTKGPTTFIPFFAIFIYHFLYQRKQKKLFSFFGILIFAVIGFSWFIYEEFSHPGFFLHFFNTEVIDRIFTTANHRNPEWYKPFTLYLPIIAAGMGLWSFYLFQPLWKKKDLRLNPELTLLFLWLLIPLLIFSISKSRLALYMIPLCIPITLFIAYWLNQINKTGLNRIIRLALISSLLTISLKGVLSFFPTKIDMKSVYKMCAPYDNGTTKFFAFNQKKLYGLNFYLKSSLSRISKKEAEPWSKETLEELLSQLKTNPNKTYNVFIARKKDSPGLYKQLISQNLHIESVSNLFWRLYIVKPRPLS